MNIRDKLRVEITSGHLSLQPNRIMVPCLLWDAAGILVTAIVLFLLNERLGEGGTILCLAIIVSLIAHALINIMFRLNVRYIFDKYENMIYRENRPFGKKQIMRLDEAVIFENCDTGNWYYVMGIKKKQFLKNYQISPVFGRSKSSQKLAFEFEEQVLTPIMELITKSVEERR